MWFEYHFDPNCLLGLGVALLHEGVPKVLHEALDRGVHCLAWRGGLGVAELLRGPEFVLEFPCPSDLVSELIGGLADLLELRGLFA